MIEPRVSDSTPRLDLRYARLAGTCMAVRLRRDDQIETWQFRQQFVQNACSFLVDVKEDERADEEARAKRREAGETASADATRSAFAASAAAVLVGALVIRLGGRAALVSVVGLDAVAELGIGDQIDQVLQYADAAGGWTIVAFLAAWVVAKVFLIDVISLALALSSGLLFGGVLEGAFISSLGSTLGSLTAFGLSRTLLQERVGKQIEKQPVARALSKVVEEDGFKTVLVLRLSPVLPIPLGTYPYICELRLLCDPPSRLAGDACNVGTLSHSSPPFCVPNNVVSDGTSKLNPLTFIAATYLGGLKPYLLDAYAFPRGRSWLACVLAPHCLRRVAKRAHPTRAHRYLGIFSKQIIDGESAISTDGSKDLLLLVGLGALVLVGVFATQLANESFDRVRQEVRKDEEARREAGTQASSDSLSSEEEGRDGLWLGPVNMTGVQAWTVERVPLAAREETDEVWRTLNRFLDELWVPSVHKAVEHRQERERERERVKQLVEAALAEEQEGDRGTMLRAALDTPRDTPSTTNEAAEPTETERAMLREFSEWSLAPAQPWRRQLLSAVLFNFVLLSGARRKWVEYPLTADALAELVSPFNTSVVAPGEVVGIASFGGQDSASGGLERAANDKAASTEGASPPSRSDMVDTQQQGSKAPANGTPDARVSPSVDAVLQSRAKVAVRQQEIEKRLEEIEKELGTQ